MSADINKTKGQSQTRPYGQRNIRNIALFFLCTIFTLKILNIAIRNDYSTRWRRRKIKQDTGNSAVFLNTRESLQVPSNTHPGSVEDHGPNSWPCFVFLLLFFLSSIEGNHLQTLSLVHFSWTLCFFPPTVWHSHLALCVSKALSNMSSVRQQTSPTEVPANTSSFLTKADHSHASNKIALPVMPEV